MVQGACRFVSATFFTHYARRELSGSTSGDRNIGFKSFSSRSGLYALQ